MGAGLRGFATARSDQLAVAPATAATALRFAPFHIDLRGSRLMRGTEVIALRPKTWSVLLYLVERPGALVTKDELLDALWPDVAVTQDTLNKSISELRIALGDDSQVPRYIETVHRRGFRFIGGTLSAVDTAPPATGPSFGERPKRSPRSFVGRDEELRFLAER